MAKHNHANVPDAVDLDNLCAAIAQDYHLLVKFDVRIKMGRVVYIARAFSAESVSDEATVYQAYASIPCKQVHDPMQRMFMLTYDLLMQASGGGATAAQRGAPPWWNGRPEIPRRKA